METKKLNPTQRKRKNILQWAGHCAKLVRQSRERELSQDEIDDLEYRRLQVKRWIRELGEDPDAGGYQELVANMHPDTAAEA